MTPADSLTVNVNLAPRLNFDDSGCLVQDMQYKAGVEGIVEGALVVVRKVIEEGSKRRRVLADERGIVLQVKNSGVLVDFGKDSKKDEILVPRTSLELYVPPEKLSTKKKKDKQVVGVVVSPELDSSKFIDWAFASTIEADIHLSDIARSILWHLHLSFCPTKKVLGFEAADAFRMVFNRLRRKYSSWCHFHNLPPLHARWIAHTSRLTVV